MGIYGALSTAVSGLRAQSQALENISGNIANSQTTGYKRTDTSFLDLIADAPLKRQVPGAVLAQSRTTNDIQGDLKTVETDTFMALNGSGFFVVEPRIGTSDGDAVFSGANYYTRRGDFEIDRSGLLVNGAGYYLKGLPIDRTTGNVSGSVPEVIQLSNEVLPAQSTTNVNYKLNLPQQPRPNAYIPGTRGSDLLQPGNFMALAADTTATVTGDAMVGADNAATVMAAGETLTLTAEGGVPVTFDFYDGNAGAYAGANIGIDVQTATPVSIATALANIQTALRAGGGSAAADATVGLSGGNLQITLGTDTFSSLTVSTTASGLGLTNGTTDPVRPSLGARVATVTANDNADFLDQTIQGGAITVYAQNGAPASVQMRWAKIDSTGTGNADTWNLFYLSDGGAVGNEPMWTNVGTDYTFGADGTMSPPVENVMLNNLTVNGVAVGNVNLAHGTGGVTQFADANGTVNTSALNQNGYGVGDYVSVAINENGRIVASYSNGQDVEVAQVVTANFNAVNQLKRLDGGAYLATTESGEAVLDLEGAVIGSALEASNTDISEEFTKLIITQQAYSAGTRIVSTADEMLQEALNMVR